MRFRREAAVPEIDASLGVELRGVGHVYGDRVVLADLGEGTLPDDTAVWLRA